VSQPTDRHKLLESPGLRSIEDLFAEIPAELRHERPLRLPGPLAESDLAVRLLELASPNTDLDEALCFIGGGVYDHYVPAIVDAIAASAGAGPVTHASPQPILQAVFELQGLFASLAALDAAAAPFPSAPLALAEAIRVAARATGRTEAVVARSANPRYRAIAATLLGPAIAFREAGYHGGATRPGDAERLLSDQAACLVVEHPNYFGCLEDVSALAALAHSHGAKLIVKVDPIALGVLAPPGQAGADIAVADAQPLGSRPAYGGSLGLLACRADLTHLLPGWRVERAGDGFQAVGAAAEGVRADAVVRPVAYLAAVGPGGLTRAASLSTALAQATQRAITSIEGFDLRFRAPFFKEFAVEAKAGPEEVSEALLESNILGALALQPDYPEMDHCLLFAATESRTSADIELLRHTLELMADTAVGGDFELDSDDG